MVINVFVLLDILWIEQWILTDIHNVMVINIKVKVKYRNFVFYKLYFLFKFVYFMSMVSSHVITESSVILAKYLPFSQTHVLGFQT